MLIMFKKAFQKDVSHPLANRIHVLVTATRCQYCGEGVMYPQVTKFEQIFSDDHQMSVAEGQVPQIPYWCGGRGDYPKSHIWG